MKAIHYLNRDAGEVTVTLCNNSPWNVLMDRRLSKSEKIDLFYRIQTNHEAVESNVNDTDTIERRLIAKYFTVEAQNIWMEVMLRARDRHIWHVDSPDQADAMILNDLFINYGVMLKTGMI